MSKKIIFLSFIFLVSCGIKGPPLPPLQEETIQKQKASDEKAIAPEQKKTAPDDTQAPSKKKKKK